MATRVVTLHDDGGENGGSRPYRFVAEGKVEECESVVRNALRVGDAARVCLQYHTVATQPDEPEALAPPQYVWAKTTAVAEWSSPAMTCGQLCAQAGALQIARAVTPRRRVVSRPRMRAAGAGEAAPS